MARYLVVGGVAGGASVAARLRRLGEKDEIIMFEKGENVSFSNCCLPYHLSGVIEQADDLVLMSPEIFWKQYRIDARVHNEVLSINREEKAVEVKGADGKTYTEHYDKLILSPGMTAAVPPIEGVDKIPHFVLKNVTDVKKIASALKDIKPKNIAVVGAGYIGIEVMENLHSAGYDVTLVEDAPQALTMFDEDIAQIIHKEIYDNDIHTHFGHRVVRCEENKIILENGREIEAQLVIYAVGGRPQSDLAKSAGLALTESGAIKTDRNFVTSDPHIYAVGDAIDVLNGISHEFMHLPLAGPAQKQAYSVANHIHGKKVVNRGYVGSSVIKVFDLVVASTGLNERTLKALGKAYEFAYVIPNDKVGLMPSAQPIHLKLLFDAVTGKIYGAQATGHGIADKRIDVIATALKFNATVTDLKDLELAYAPPFGTAKDVVNFAGYVGENILTNVFKQIPVSEVRKLVEEKACIVDVREEDEFALGHIKSALNIPLSQIRERLSEIPADRPVYLHCRSAQRSYNALLILQQEGYENVYNISGSYLGICCYEYFRDKTEDREPIVTAYNFL